MAAQDVIFAAVIIFSFSVMFFITSFVVSTMTIELTSAPIFNESVAAQASLETMNTVSDKTDYIIFGIFMMLCLGILITGWFIGGHAILMFIYFIVIAIGVALSAIFSNIWEEISLMTIFGNTIDAFPLTNHLMLYLPIYISILGFVGITVMFAKPYVSQQ